MFEFIFGRVPPQDQGGFHFYQKLPGGGEFPIVASTKKDLDDKILDYRIKNGLEIGNPPAESNLYLCSLWPHLCNRSTPKEADEEQGGLRQRTTAWRYNRYSQAQTVKELESEETAEARAQICSNCPNNQSNKDGCTPCVAENDRVLFMLRQGRATVTKVGGCAITGQDNETAAFLPKSMLKYADKYKDKLPSFCWLLNG